MTGSTLYIVFGVAFIAVLAGAVALIRRRREPGIGKRDALHPMLILGIVFLVPGLMDLILDGESSVFLNLGIIFTLSGLVAHFLIRTPEDPETRHKTLVSSFIGFMVGGASGAALSLVFDLPSLLIIILSGVLGLLVGMVVGRHYQSRRQV